MANLHLPTQQLKDSETIILYGRADCPSVPGARVVLERSGAPFEYVDIRSNEGGRLYVCDLNHGNESVPTLVFPDGATLTEPSNQTLHHKLLSMGYEFQRPKWVSLFENLLRRIGI